jgi:orotidine-5'-phosphate decarboxylase
MAHPLLSQDPLDRLVFALDVDTAADALAWADRLHGALRWLKVGPKLFTGNGPQLIDALIDRGFRIFLDLKFHDIPEVVAGAVREATRRRVSMLTLHTTGGARMMQAAATAAREEGSRLGIDPLLLLGVTVLTSLGAADLAPLGFAEGPEALVPRLATLAVRSGLDGVVCSPREIGLVKAVEPGAAVLTPGIRPATLSDDGRPIDVPGDDQVRIATPAEAIRAGADFLVIGRPIRLAPDPLRAIERVLIEMR